MEIYARVAKAKRIRAIAVGGLITMAGFAINDYFRGLWGMLALCVVGVACGIALLLIGNRNLREAESNLLMMRDRWDRP